MHRIRESEPVKPVQLISFDQNKNLILSQQAINIFTQMQAQQLHIITVAGKYRTGKSYILNRVLLNKNSGFEVGPTINACTKGLWMWPQIVKIQDGDTVKDCIVVDTEGLGSLEEGENTDIKIFLMATLISSYLIYNSVGSIDEKAIENLSLIINLAEMLQKENNHYDSQELINSFPSFMWLVRDFSLRLENQDGQQMTSSEYLESALKYQKSGTKAAEKKNNIRKKLKTFFQDRDCFTLIRPTENQKNLQNLSSLPEKYLRPEFVKLINQLQQRIKGGLKPKKVRGKAVTPQGFIQLCQYFVTTVNQGKLPSINSHWDNLCVNESARILEKFVKLHRESLEELLDKQQEDDDLKSKKSAQIHKQILLQAEISIDKSFLGKLEKQLTKERLDKVLNDSYQEALRSINQKKQEVVKGIVNEIFVEILDEFSQQKLESFEEIFARFEEIKEKYKNKEAIYESFYENSKDVFQEFVRNLKNKWERQFLVLNEKNNFLEVSIAQNTEEMQTKFQQIRQKSRQIEQKSYKCELISSQLREENKDLKQQCKKLLIENGKLKELIDEKQQEEMQRKQLDLIGLQSKMNEEIKYFQRKNSQLEIEVSKLSEQMKDLQIKERKTVREMQIFKNKCSEYLKQNFSLTELIEKLKKKQLNLQKQRRKKNLNINENTPEIVKELSKKIDELEIKISSKEEQCSNLAMMLESQRLTNETILKNPQNLNYTLMKKNYEIERENNNKLQQKLNEFEKTICLSTLTCQICSQKVDYRSIKSHTRQCFSNKNLSMDVSYEYNGSGKIHFLIEIFLDNQNWVITKTVDNIRLMLKKMNLEFERWSEDRTDFDNLNQVQECRAFLDDTLNGLKDSIWGNSFLVEFFGLDIHWKREKKGVKSKLLVDLQSIQSCDENRQPSQNLMKTTKFCRKTFNFGCLL